MDVFQYTTRFQSIRGGVTGLPPWARSLVFLAALPGIALIGLSILAILVSILALLLPTVPLYRFLKAVTSPEPRRTREAGEGQYSIVDPDADDSGPRKRVEATVIEPNAGDDRVG